MMAFWHRKLFLIICDIILVVFALLSSLLVRFEGKIPPQFIENKEIYFLLMALICVLWLSAFRLYDKLWRYAGVGEVIAIFNAISLSYASVGLVVFISGGRIYPRSIVIIGWAFTLLLLGGVRMLLKIISLSHRERRRRIPVLIVGEGDNAESLLREFLRNKTTEYLPVGLISVETPLKTEIHGIPVLGSIDDIPKFIESYNVKQLFIALPYPSSEIINKLLEIGSKLNIKVNIIPSMLELLEFGFSPQVREIRIDDLLGRKPIYIDTTQIEKFIQKKVILITGAGGSIGRELVKFLLTYQPKKLILLGRGENSIYELGVEIASRKGNTEIEEIIGDIRNKDKMEEIFATYRPDVVFHTAAHKHVPLMETNIDEAISNNIIGTYILAELASKFKVNSFINISTDKSVEPTSVMGATKRVAEEIVYYFSTISKTRFISVRFGNVLGSRGSVVPTFKRQIEQRVPVTVTHPDMERYFMTIPEAAQLTLQASAIGKGGDIMLLDMGRPLKIVELAERMIQLSGLVPYKDIPIVFSGLRPGEKIVEKLVGKGEELLPTSVKNILKVKFTPLDSEFLLFKIKELREALKNLDKLKMLDILNVLVAGFNRKEGGEEMP